MAETRIEHFVVDRTVIHYGEFGSVFTVEYDQEWGSWRIKYGNSHIAEELDCDDLVALSAAIEAALSNHSQKIQNGESR